MCSDTPEGAHAEIAGTATAPQQSEEARQTRNATQSASDLNNEDCASDLPETEECKMEDCSEVELVRRLISSGRSADARELVHELKEARPHSDTPEVMLSEIYLSESNLSDASACIMALLGRNPKNTAALRALVKLYDASGDIVKALDVRSLPLEVRNSDLPAFGMQLVSV
jgi:predicted Zn-dependent protease